MEHDDFEEPDVDSDFDYEENKKKKKKALAKSTPKVWKWISLVVSILSLLCCMMCLFLLKIIFKQTKQTLLLLSWQTPSTRGRKKQIPMNYDATDTEKPYSCESELLFLFSPTRLD